MVALRRNAHRRDLLQGGARLDLHARVLAVDAAHAGGALLGRIRRVGACTACGVTRRPAGVAARRRTERRAAPRAGVTGRR